MAVINQSRFICLKCKTENRTGEGLVRAHGRRKKLHVKSLECLTCKTLTYNVEVRDCDFMEEIIEHVPELNLKYYPE